MLERFVHRKLAILLGMRLHSCYEEKKIQRARSEYRPD